MGADPDVLDYTPTVGLDLCPMALISSDRQRQFGTPTLRRIRFVSPAYLYLKKRRNPLSPGEYVTS